VAKLWVPLGEVNRPKATNAHGGQRPKLGLGMVKKYGTRGYGLLWCGNGDFVLGQHFSLFALAPGVVK